MGGVGSRRSHMVGGGTPTLTLTLSYAGRMETSAREDSAGGTRLPSAVPGISRGRRLGAASSALRRIVIALNRGKLNFRIRGRGRGTAETEGCGRMIVPNKPRPHLTAGEQQSHL